MIFCGLYVALESIVIQEINLSRFFDRKKSLIYFWSIEKQ